MIPPITFARARIGPVRIRRIEAADIAEAVAQGFEDFKTMPSHYLLLSVIYPAIGLVIGELAIGNDVLPLLFPFAAGFALIGPFAAIWLVELSRRRERGLDPYIWRALSDFEPRSVRSILMVGAALAAIFIAWLATADAIYALTLGHETSASVGDFLGNVLTTPGGWALIILGNGFGFFFAAASLTLGVVSVPLLLDRHDVNALTALEISVRATLVNPKPMAIWGLTVAAGLVLGVLPFFLGLVIVMPVLSHATWHLYRKVVES